MSGLFACYLITLLNLLTIHDEIINRISQIEPRQHFCGMSDLKGIQLGFRVSFRVQRVMQRLLVRDRQARGIQVELEIVQKERRSSRE